MMKNFGTSVLGALACAALLAGCGDDGMADAHEHSSHTMGDAGHDSHAMGDAAATAEARASADEIAVGLTKEGEHGAVSAELASASPSPPTKGLNDWSVKVMDMTSGEPVEVGTTRVMLDMPNHDHQNPVGPTIAAADEAGVYTWTGLKTNMGGLWVIDAYFCEAQGVEHCDMSSESFVDTVEFRVWIRD